MSVQQSIEEHIPEWFSLAKYDVCADMSLEAWRHAILDRQAIKFSLSRGEDALWRHGFARSIERLFRDSISKLGGIYVVQPTSYPGRHKFDSDSSYQPSPVSPVTVGSLFHLANAALNTGPGMQHGPCLLSGQEPNSYQEARKLWDFAKSSVDNVVSESEELTEIWYEDNTVHLAVELSFSDEDLIRSFTEQIRAMRQEYSATENESSLPKESARKKYHKHRVLAYIDLVLWFQYKKIPITHHKMGQILFPQQYDQPLDDRVRRTVKPLADQILSLDLY